MKYLILIALLLSACVEIPTPTPLPTLFPIPTSAPTETPIATNTPTPTLTPTVSPVRRMVWDMNAFPVGSAEWKAWNEYDAELRRLDAEAKFRGEIGLSADEQMQIWANALRKYGVIQ